MDCLPRAWGDVVRVAGAEDDLDLAAGADARHGGEIGGEGGEAAAVTGHLHAVRPHRGVLVHGLEAQDRAHALPVRGDGDAAAVPDGIEVIAVPDPGGLGLRGEGDGDRLRELTLEQAALPAGVALVDLELPGAVQAQPGGALQLGAGVLGPGHITGGRRRGVQDGGELLGPGEQGRELSGQSGQGGGLSGHGLLLGSGSTSIGCPHSISCAPLLQRGKPDSARRSPPDGPPAAPLSGRRRGTVVSHTHGAKRRAPRHLRLL